MRKDSQTLFISHSANDKALALQIKKLFKGRLGSRGSRVEVFCSSGIESIEGGKAWFNEIIRALRRSRVCISLLTPYSIYRPWILFESGGSFIQSEANQEDHRMFPLCAHGTRVSNLPGPLMHIRARDLGAVQEVRRLYREVSALFGSTSPLSNATVAKVCAEAKRGSRHWDKVRQALQGDRLDSTPFSADELLRNAEQLFFAAGQNLHHLATSTRFRRQLFAWLNARPSRKAQLLICDPRDRVAVAAWTAVGPQFEKDLTRSVRGFREWLVLARDRGLHRRLDIRVTKLVTTGLVCVDPETPRGTVVVTPIVFGKPISGERPHFVLSKGDNIRAFDHYWETYRNEFGRGESLARVQVPARKPNPLVQPTRKKPRAADQAR